MVYTKIFQRFNSYSAGIDFCRQKIDFSCQNLTTKVDPRTVRVNIFIMPADP